MSNFRAIAAVTVTLQQILTKAAEKHDLDPVPSVVSKPPAILDDDKDFVNIFMYMARENPAGRNMELPARGAGGRRLSSYPLVLDLHFLLAVYAKKALRTDLLFGLSVQALHENPVLNREEITTAVSRSDALKDSEIGLANQIEQIKITPNSLTTEEISKLWSAFQTPFRTSAAYTVSVVMIETDEPATSPLPVISVGLDVSPSLTSPLPAITAIEPPAGQTAVRVGETLLLRGENLNGTSISVSFRHRLKKDPIEVSVPGDNDDPKQIQIPLAANGEWIAGLYGVRISLQPSGETRSRITNEMPVTLAPAVRVDDAKISVTGTSVTFDEVEAVPLPTPEQTFSLLVGSQELIGEFTEVESSSGTEVTRLKFTGPKMDPGEYFYRLRVDGVDSLLVISDADGKPKFDDNQKLTIGTP